MFRLLATTLVVLALPFAANAGWQFNGVPVSTAPYYQADPLIVSDGAGGAIIAWYDLRGGSNYDIYAQRLNAAGVPQWTADGVPVCTQTGTQILTAMVSDDAGGAVMVWYDDRNSIQTANDVYAQRIDGSGAPLWTVDGVAVSLTAGNQWYPDLIRSGNFFVVAWRDDRAGNGDDIYAQSLNSVGNPQWMADGVALCTATGIQFFPHLCGDQIGGAIVSWTDLRAGNRDIYARFIDRFGNVQWTNNGVAVSNAANDQDEPRIVSDSAAGAIITWYDWRSGPADIYVQRLDSSGASLWGANGLAVSTASGIQSSPTITQDFSGGAVIVWEDHRPAPNDPDIYGQRVDPSGTPQWTANGMPVCAVAGLQLVPRIVRDPTGGFLVTWFDYRSGNSDVYAQRLDYFSTLWTPNGVVLSTEPHAQEMPSICPDGIGGAIVAWRDLREGNYWDVYAEHVNGSGPTGVERTPLATSLRVSNYPNPFTGDTTLQLSLPSASDVSVDVYDVAGRRVREYSFPRQVKGWSDLRIDDRDDHGKLLPSGVYFYRVQAGNGTVTKKMVIAR